MKCRQCGKDIDEKATFCPFCGNKISIEPVEDGMISERGLQGKKSWLKEEKILFNKKFTNEHILYLITAIISIIVCFLPYYTISILGYTESINALEIDLAIYIPILALLGIICMFFKNEFMMMWFSIIQLVIILLVYGATVSNAKEVGLGSFSIGCYLLLIFGVLLTLFGCHLAIINKKSKEERSNFMNAMVLRFKIGAFFLIVLIILLILAAIFNR